MCIGIYPGQYYDAETGLHYNWHRYYDPGTGRYLTPDPIGIVPYGPEVGYNHLYNYVQQHPINDTDPKGLLSTATEVLLSKTANKLLGKHLKKALNHGDYYGLRCAYDNCRKGKTPSQSQAYSQCSSLFNRFGTPPNLDAMGLWDSCAKTCEDVAKKLKEDGKCDTCN